MKIVECSVHEAWLLVSKCLIRSLIFHSSATYFRKLLYIKFTFMKQLR